MDFIKTIYWDKSYNNIVIINLALVISMFAFIRIFSGSFLKTNSDDELTAKNNAAFGISVAGITLALTFILSGAISGMSIDNLGSSINTVLLYGSLGIILLTFSRLIFDRLLLKNISIFKEIRNGNVSAGIIDAGNLLATAIIVYASMTWVDNSSNEGTFIFVLAFFVSQLFLALITYTRMFIFKQFNDDKTLESCFEKDNKALATRFASHRIGFAFAILGASNMMAYEVYNPIEIVIGWSIISLAAIIILAALEWVAEKVIFWNIDINQELVAQNNMAVAISGGVIYICLALLLVEFSL
ncbi:MAG: DUF350 domain-containing protein [Rickettsiales bacterium]|nr:DUF350 domain-containing protein [Rickettsiales bacterium]